MRCIVNWRCRDFSLTLHELHCDTMPYKRFFTSFRMTQWVLWSHYPKCRGGNLVKGDMVYRLSEHMVYNKVDLKPHDCIKFILILMSSPPSGVHFRLDIKSNMNKLEKAVWYSSAVSGVTIYQICSFKLICTFINI